MKLDEKKRNILIAVIIIISLGIWIGATSFSSIDIEEYPGGWEVEANLDSIFANSQNYDSRNKPEHTVSWGAAYAKFDVDEELEGAPTTSIQVHFPEEYVNFRGDWVKAREGESFDEIYHKIGDECYFFEQHVFFFEMRIIAEADWSNVWGHIYGEAKNMINAEPSEVNVFIIFDTPLWTVRDTISSNNGTAIWKKSGIWTGVMSAACVENYGGYVDELPDDFDGHPGAWSVTNVGRLNMFYINGDDASNTNFNDFDTNETETYGLAGVPDEVLIEIAGTSLEPGWWWPSPSATIGTYAVQAEYRIRVDVLTAAKYTFQTGNQDDELDDANVSDETEPPFELIDFSWLTDAIGNFFSDPKVFIMIIVIIIAIAVIVPKILAPRSR